MLSFSNVCDTPYKHIWIECNGVNATFNKERGKFRIVAWSLPAEAHLHTSLMRFPDQILYLHPYRLIILVKEIADNSRVAIESQCQLGQVIRANRKPIEEGRELFD